MPRDFTTGINWGREFKSSFAAALWMCLLTCPMVAFKINAAENTIDYRWNYLIYVAAGTFILSGVWRFMLARRDYIRQSKAEAEFEGPAPDAPRGPAKTWVDVVMSSKYRNQGIGVGLLVLASLPLWASPYTINILITALIYISLGLGLNIVVGVSGLLNLGYVAFYAIGAYTYALLNHYFGLGFWVCLPLGALASTLMGLMLGFPVLRLRGDYLAIVTLGFGEIVRLVLVNMGDITMGPRGISNISPPSLFGLDLNKVVKPVLLEWVPTMSPNLDLNKAFLFFIMMAVVIITIVVVFRLENSRLGRAWLAMREDEIACQAMGIDRTRAKLTAFALGATWAGLAGVVFAAQVTFINPTSFTFMQSVMILSIVVLGGMGSIPGVIIGALVLILLPEYLRAFSDYRMLIFGALMVLMMVFRPGGLIQSVRETYVYKPLEGGAGGEAKK
ncbi:branched-chain amino acid ABC transporter permease [Deltaproteobacteria bacterium Smac51]|nr:branched-chain amino acid ABC transporter permease [Deltaproteobacteria bacterium Smac51]